MADKRVGLAMTHGRPLAKTRRQTPRSVISLSPSKTTTLIAAEHPLVAERAVRIAPDVAGAYRQARFLQDSLQATVVPPLRPALPRLRTSRLVLRTWRESDLAPFAELNADPRVMQHLGGVLSRDASDARARAYSDEIEKHGFSFWAVEAPGIAPFIGFVGLRRASFEAPFCPCVEIGWRLAFDAWGHGYATEGGRALLEYGFAHLGLSEILAWTVPANTRSQGVMMRLGMRRSAADDFDHPNLPEAHPLRRHVLYRVAHDRGAITKSPCTGS